MSRTRSGICLLGTVLACASVARAQGAEPSGVPALATDGVLYNDAKIVGIPKPVNWKFANVVSRPVSTDMVASVSVLACLARTVEFGNIHIDVWLLNGASSVTQLQAVDEKLGKCLAGHVHENQYELKMEPVPHASYLQAEDPSSAILMVHLPANGRGMTVMFEMPKARMPKARATLLQLAQAVKVNLPVWPVREPGYEYVTESGFELAFLPSTTKKHRSAMRKMVKATVKDFTKDHGAPRFLEQAPVVVYVERDGMTRGRLVGFEGEASIARNEGLRRIASPVVSAKDRKDKASFCGALYGYMLTTIYPARSCEWMLLGEELLYRMELRCGKSLPTLHKNWIHAIKIVERSLPDVLTKTRDQGITWQHCASWIAWFRLGPSKHRKAYAAYLEELRSGVDPGGARERLLAACDDDELWSDARRLLAKKLKVAKD